MKRPIVVLLAAVALLISLSALTSCNSYEPKSTAKQAASYYWDKYHEKASVTESNELGSYGLFGFNPVGMEYLMSDGSSVAFIDNEGMFRDNRQSETIQEEARAFAEGKMGAIPGALTPASIRKVGDDVDFSIYQGRGLYWHERYDGDIGSFLMKERPRIDLRSYSSGEDQSSGRFTYEMAYDVAQADGLEEAYLDLARYFDLRFIGLAVVDPESFEKGETSLFDDALCYTVEFQEGPSGNVTAERFKPTFISLMDGIEVSSAAAGVVLEEGDVRFEPTGEPGFFTFRRSGAAEQEEDTAFFVRNDTDAAITEVTGIDTFEPICNAHETRAYVGLEEGAAYYLGDDADIRPWIEVESVTSEKVVFRYHTHFKDQIWQASFNAIGFAKKGDSGASQTVKFDSRILGETEDGWRGEVYIRDDAVRRNEFAFQFTYNADLNTSVQVMREIELPIGS